MANYGGVPKPGFQPLRLGAPKPPGGPFGRGLQKPMTTPPVPGASTKIRARPVSRPRTPPGTLGTSVLNPVPATPGEPTTSSGLSTLPTIKGTPLDATYWNNVIGHNFTVGNQITGLQGDISNAGTNYQRTMGNLDYQQPRDELNLEQGANRTGGLFSSVYNQNLGNLGTRYADSRSGALTTFGNAWGGDLAKIAALQGGVPIYNNSQAVASGTRASTAAANNPGSGESTGGHGGHAPGHGSGGHSTGGTTGHVPTGLGPGKSQAGLPPAPGTHNPGPTGHTGRSLLIGGLGAKPKGSGKKSPPLSIRKPGHTGRSLLI